MKNSIPACLTPALSTKRLKEKAEQLCIPQTDGTIKCDDIKCDDAKASSAAPASQLPTFAAASIASSAEFPVAEAVWEVRVRRDDQPETVRREHLLSQMRSALEKKLYDDPGARELIWRTPLGTVEARRHTEIAAPGIPFRLAFASEGRDLAPALSGFAMGGSAMGRPANAPEGLPVLRLPDEATRLLGERLVGLEAQRRDTLQRWECRWDGVLDAWARRTGHTVPPALAEQMTSGHALLLFHGDPGLGKSALARAAADRYCRDKGVSGSLVSLTTQARGQGLVGDFSQRLRAAFTQLAAMPENEMRVLLIDEADALAMRRSEAQSHQEDRAATSTLIQCLDEVAGQRRLSVIMTTNTPQNIDAAIQRRAHLIAFGRPAPDACRTLLCGWLPHLSDFALRQAADAAAGMTPADIDRVMEEAWLGAVAADVVVSLEQAVLLLRQGERTGSV